MTRLREILLRLGERVMDQFQTAITAMLNQDPDQALRVLDRSYQLGLLVLDAEEDCLRLIARIEPEERDLRSLLILSKAVVEAERVGETTAAIARQVLESRKRGKPSERLVEVYSTTLAGLADMVQHQLERALRALREGDIAAAAALLEEEPALREAYAEVCRLLGDLDAQYLDACHTDCLAISANALEYLGLRAVKIAELAIYAALDYDIRYRGREWLIDLLRREGYLAAAQEAVPNPAE
jgi:phosphate transport system protein